MTSNVIPLRRPAVPPMHISDELTKFVALRAELATVGIDLHRMFRDRYLACGLFDPVELANIHEVVRFARELGLIE